MDWVDISNNFTYKWCTSIDDIRTEDWIKIYGTDIIKSQNFFRANERACFDGVEFHYLLVFKGDFIVAIVPCFSYCIDILNIASSNSVRRRLVWIRKFYPSFLKLRAFVTGSYAATCEHFIEYLPTLKSNEIKEVSDIIGAEIKKRCNETKSAFVFVKDVRERAIAHVRRILTNDYSFFVSFPTTAIPILKNVPYPEGLKKKNRKRYRMYRKAFDSSFHWEIAKDFSGEKAVEFYALYKAVLDKAKNKFEFLNASFFDYISSLLEEQSFILIAKDNVTDETRVMELVLEHEDKLIPLYLGIKYKDDDTKVLYLNTIFRTVKEAECRGKAYVDLGQTSYYPKTMSGALVENIYYGFWSGKPIVRWFINHLLGKIFRLPFVPEHVYLERNADEAHHVLTDKGFVLRN